MPTVKCYDKYGKEIDHLTQWDINVSLKIHDFEYDIAPVCHFATRFGKTSKTVTSTLSDGVVSVPVPNVLLTENKQITMFVFLYDLEEDTGRTVYEVELPVHSKPKPDDFEFSDNVEIIQISEFKVRLEALVAQAEEMVNVRIGGLEESYQNAINEIKAGIAEDSETLNQKILVAKDHFVQEINDKTAISLTEVRNAKEQLSSQIETGLSNIIDNIPDGSPKGVFETTSDLRGKSAGIYLCVNSESENNGYIYYWNGTELSRRLLYYDGAIINDGTITFEKLSPEFQAQCLGKTISYTLVANNWNNNVQELDLSSYYSITNHTRIDVDFDSTANSQLIADDCTAIYVVNNENNDNKVFAHCLGNTPTVDIIVQLTIKETI